jgi:ABC-type amino acid transport substrate-binding protein
MKASIAAPSLAAILLVLSCGAPGGKAPATAPAPAKIQPAKSLSATAVRVAEMLRAHGGLRVATTSTIAIYEPGQNGAFDGFQAKLAQRFADWLGVPMTIKAVAFDSFFSVKGVVPKDLSAPLPEGSRPDIFDDTDLIAHSLTDLPWRSRLVRIVPVLPNRIMIITRRGEEVSSVRGLSGKSLVVMSTTSYEAAAEGARKALGLDLKILKVPYGEDVYADVLAGRADATLRDSDTAVAPENTKRGLSIAWPLSDLQWTGWAVAPDDKDLAEVLTEFLSVARADGSFARIFGEYYRLSLDAYYGLIRYREVAKLALSQAQEKRLEELRAKDGLRVAINKEFTIYDPAAAEIGAAPSVIGFHYSLAKRFADDLGLALVVIPVTFDEFFSVGGVVPPRAKTDPSYTYVPDLLKRSDLYVSNLSPVEWRKKFLRFTPLYPNSIVYVSRTGVPVDKPRDLDGLRVALLLNTTYESWLKTWEKNDGVHARPILVGNMEEAFRLVSKGGADATLSDACLALGYLKIFRNLRISPALPPDDVISWAVAKGDDALGSILDAWVESAKANGVFESLWKDYFGSSFAEYLGLIAAEE